MEQVKTQTAVPNNKGETMVMLNQGGKWIKSAEVESGERITIKNEGEWQESTQYKYPNSDKYRNDFVVTVLHNGEEKNMRMNKTNRDTLSASYGKDTAKWVGKVAEIQKMKALVAGKQMDVIVLEAKPEDQGEATPEVDIPF